MFRIPPPFLWTPPTPQRERGSSPLSSPCGRKVLLQRAGKSAGEPLSPSPAVTTLPLLGRVLGNTVNKEACYLSGQRVGSFSEDFWGRGQQDARPAQGPLQTLGAATRIPLSMSEEELPTYWPYRKLTVGPVRRPGKKLPTHWPCPLPMESDFYTTSSTVEPPVRALRTTT